ncbi:DUF1259 domain-containing protein [Clostridium sp. DJ247]|uniref:DUF1259 domain-containing protein n=1 Tax=Clostridium sp. DJ247 TaxID=2726188 RepID=UPI001626D84C|nr:DUF1259 domain-containing protein [Clostridium sp. DJ247]MBC2581919.1 DUF1259 domain-containing protein [Clostridium sp. DJ247]
MSHNLCQEFADILGAEIISNQNGVCVVGFNRNLNVTILGRRSRSSLTLGALFSFESMDIKGRTLNLGETVILQSELNEFIDALRSHDIIVTAFHNHWLFEEPRLMYIHFESIDKPLAFARKVADALTVLRS